MASKYGRPGATDPDGFDPYADTVGAGIYSGNVVRDEKGNVVIGQQYQNHNPRPGPMYDGTGYTAMSSSGSSTKITTRARARCTTAPATRQCRHRAAVPKSQPAPGPDVRRHR